MDSDTDAPTTDNPERLLSGAPDDYGLMVTLDSTRGCGMKLVPDAPLTKIHCNAYGPASLYNLHRLGGGGSGVTVFQGEDPTLGSLVMKHGGSKDTKELFALAKIAQELLIRSNNESNAAAAAAADMQARLPEFRMIYISPHHLRERGRELWRRLKSILFAMRSSSDHDCDVQSVGFAVQFEALFSNDNHNNNGMIKNDSSHHEYCGRSIRLYTGNKEEDGAVTFTTKLHSDWIDMFLGADEIVTDDVNDALIFGSPDEGYECLKAFTDELMDLQKEWLWKVTLAQKTIGGPNPKTGLYWLAAGLLHGDLLETLIREFIHVIRNLQKITLPEETDVIQQVREEVAEIEGDPSFAPEDVSSVLDAFVGLHIKKNFHPEYGRFKRLQNMGKAFRSGSLTLTEEEVLPGHLLGVLLQRGSLMSSVFEGAPAKPLILYRTGYLMNRWRYLLKDATSLQGNAALHRIWNCGLADAGLHNLFLSPDSLVLFDIGDPTLQTLPAFLTKFLFSFFHNLGMVDDPKTGCWVNRFVPGDKLSLTAETKALLPQIYDAFTVTLDRFVDVLFDGEEAVRGLLIKYVMMQLMSDASFCLERWTIKGGGKARDRNHHKNIEQWLWRALWDLYIAMDLNINFRRQFMEDYTEAYAPSS